MKILLTLIAMVACVLWGTTFFLGIPAHSDRATREARRNLRATMAQAAEPAGHWGMAAPSALTDPAVALVRLHVESLVSILPVGLLFVGSGIAFGLARREGLRSGSRFASASSE